MYIFFLFLIITIDLNKVLKFTHAPLYAGDTTIIVTGKNLRFMSIKVNKDLETPNQRSTDGKLILNVKRTEYMIFHHKNMILDYNHVLLIIHNNTIEHEKQFKLLGIWLDNDLDDDNT